MLTRQRVHNYLAIFAVGGFLAVAGSLTGRLANPQRFGVPLPDYLAHWTAGRMVIDGMGAELYSPEVQMHVQHQLEGTVGHLAWFVSPPFVAAVYAPLALLPYVASALSWTAISLGVLTVCVSRMPAFCPRLWAAERRLVVLAIAGSYPVFELMAGGQDSAVSLAVWMAGMHLAARKHDVASGAVFALGLIKPQLVVLVPVVFVAERRWRALLSFAAAGALITLGGVLLLGWHSMTTWLDAVRSPLYLDQVTLGQSWKMASLPALATALTSSAGVGGAPVVGSVVAGGMAAAFAVWAAGPRRSPALLLPMALATTVAASPHLVLYDALLFIPVILILVEKLWTAPMVRLSVALAFVVAWVAPALHTMAGRLDGPLGQLDAPWVAIPIAVLWYQMLSLREVGLGEPSALRG